MKKRTKVIIGIGLSLLILVLGGLGFAGDYFYTLAIDAHSDKSCLLYTSYINDRDLSGIHHFFCFLRVNFVIGIAVFLYSFLILLRRHILCAAL